MNGINGITYAPPDGLGSEILRNKLAYKKPQRPGKCWYDIVPEIRNMIYELVIVEDAPIRINSVYLIPRGIVHGSALPGTNISNRNRFKAREIVEPKGALALLSTSKFVRGEMIGMYYGKKRFVFGNGKQGSTVAVNTTAFDHFTNTVPADAYKCIRKITFSLYFDSDIMSRTGSQVGLVRVDWEQFKDLRKIFWWISGNLSALQEVKFVWGNYAKEGKNHDWIEGKKLVHVMHEYFKYLFRNPSLSVIDFRKLSNPMVMVTARNFIGMDSDGDEHPNLHWSTIPCLIYFQSVIKDAVAMAVAAMEDTGSSWKLEFEGLKKDKMVSLRRGKKLG